MKKIIIHCFENKNPDIFKGKNLKYSITDGNMFISNWETDEGVGDTYYIAGIWTKFEFIRMDSAIEEPTLQDKPYYMYGQTLSL